MTRPRRHLWLSLAFVAAAFIVAPRLPPRAAWSLGALGLALSAACLWAGLPLFRARSLMRQRRWAEAATHLATFRGAAAASAWRRALGPVYLGVYSSDALAVADATLGALRLEEDRLDEARQHLEAAVARDPGYAVPHANLALVFARQGDVEAARAARQRARALGFARASLDEALAPFLGDDGQ